MWPAIREFLILTALYLGYTASRLLASDDRRLPVRHARALRRLEADLGLDLEHRLIHLALAHPLLGLVASYWYSTAHYVATPMVLVWLYRRHRSRFAGARTALAIATFAALVLYLAVPTAPPRLLPGYVDVLAAHAGAGWWGSDASAPRGLGALTNSLAAFPSLHAGWALWVALAITGASRSRTARAAGWAHALLTAAAVLITANHWVLDVLAGWSIVAFAWMITGRAGRARGAAAEPGEPVTAVSEGTQSVPPPSSLGA